jgi:hydroxymethylpyrimidine pyrophosphatase-like HAD family hydrolase
LAERLSLERPSDESLAVTGWRVNKGTTLLWLCDSLNIDPAKVLTAGDTEADSEAFRHTRGIAVGTQVLPHSRHRVENPAALAMLLAQGGDLESKSMATAAAC